MNYLKLSLYLLFIASLTSCKDYQDVEIMGIESTRILELDSKGIEVELSMRVKNPNGFGFTVTGTDMDCTLNGVKVGKLDLEDNIRVKAKSEDLHTFRVKSDFSNAMAGGIASLIGLLQKKSATVNLKGDLKVRSYFFFRKRFPVDLTEKIPLPGK